MSIWISLGINNLIIAGTTFESSISVEEIFSLSESEETDDTELDNIGVTLGMCTVMGISMDEKCSVMYRYLGSRNIDSIVRQVYEDLC